jgi:hypothetical protein
MKKLIWFSSLCLLITTFACTPKEEDQLSTLNIGSVDHFAFGTYYGHCLSNCTHVYKLEGNGLYPDLIDRGYPDTTIAYDTKSLSTDAVNSAKTLLKDFPADLLKEKEQVGCPDCADHGGFYVEIKQGETTRSWRIDTDDKQIPAYLSAYTAKIRKTLDGLAK